MLPGRTGSVTSAARPDPELISIALRRAHSVLDAVDNGDKAYLRTGLGMSSGAREDARAWAWACLLLIDECDIDSVTVSAIATKVWKGVQDALDIF